MTPEFWSGKRVFMTGHTGFKGGWLSLWLNDLGAVVKGYSLEAPTDPSFFDVVGVADFVEHEIGDVRDAMALAASVADFQPDIVLHLAAQPLVRFSYVDPVETVTTNVVGTMNLLEAIRGVASVKAFVNVTTDKCYENREWHWGYREDEAMGGHDLYSASKACSELITTAYRRSFFSEAADSGDTCAVGSGRAGNVIGGGDWAQDRLIPDILRELSMGNSVEIRNPGATRPWQHVLEPLSGYLTLAEHLYEAGEAFAQAWNFGPDQSGDRTVEWIVAEMISQWDGPAAWHSTAEPQPHEANYLKLDCSRARDLLGWVPTWSLTEALAAVVSWHRAYLNSEDMRKVSLQQIAEFAGDDS